MPNQKHSSGNKPEWQGEFDLNFWQEVAELTNGVATPGNFLTATGLAANIEACRILRSGNVKKGTLSGQDLAQACGLLAIDGFFDLFDGAAATATGTRSPLGRKLDAGTDLIRMANSIHALWRSGIISNTVAAALTTEKVATFVPSAIANIRGNEPVVGTIGKGLAASQRFTAGLYLLSATFEQLAIEEVSSPVKRSRYEYCAEYSYYLALGNLAASVALTVPATVPYVRAARGIKQKHVLGGHHS